MENNSKEIIKEKVYCENCGATVSEEDIYCPKCGLKFENEEDEPLLHCENCGATVSEDDIYCPKCGLKFEKEEDEYFLHCENCGATVNEEDIYCPKCGLKFENEEDQPLLFCENCGTIVSEEDVYCPKCSLRFENKKMEENLNDTENNIERTISECSSFATTTEQRNNDYCNLKYNSACIISFVFGIISMFLTPAGLPPIIALISSIIGLCSFDDKKQKSKWFGVVGLIFGIVFFINYLHYYNYFE